MPKLNFISILYPKAYQMIGTKSIAVVGGGISSMSMLLNMAQKCKSKDDTCKVKVFQRNVKVGGRISAEQSPQDEEHQTFCADVGANYIDYENEQQKKFVESNIPKNLLQNFKAFQGKFLIYENSKLTQPEQQKTRYFYQRGFRNMASDWKKQIESEKTMDFSVVGHNEVMKVQWEKQNKKWRIRLSGEKKESEGQLFDLLIFGTPAPITKQILERSSLEKTKSLLSQLDKIKYTQQLSIVFELDQGQMKSSESPYSILFKDYDLTFICFHQQKYPNNERNIAVVQMNEEFTQKYAKKLSPEGKDVQLSHNQIQKEISEEVWKLIPEEIRDKFKFTQKCLGVHYWPQSLLKPSSQVEAKQEMFNRFNHELNKDFTNDKGQPILYFTGDYLNNKSRVTGAMAVGMRLGQQIMKDHFGGEKKKLMM